MTILSTAEIKNRCNKLYDLAISNNLPKSEGILMVMTYISCSSLLGDLDESLVTSTMLHFLNKFQTLKPED